MLERPILFSAPMVRALLAGTKTKTRRVVKLADLTRHPDNDPWYKLKVWSWRLRDSMWTDHTWESLLSKCPYGQPGDHLWVRETWCDPSREGYPIMYRADCINGEYHWGVDDDGRPITAPEVSFKWKPSIHMFRDFSRITLEITAVRVERLQDISEEDAKAEGIQSFERRTGGQTVHARQTFWGLDTDTASEPTPRSAYELLWESINGPVSWEANPWVWVVEFKRVK